jgi:hypothetical protein
MRCTAEGLLPMGQLQRVPNDRNKARPKWLLEA